MFGKPPRADGVDTLVLFNLSKIAFEHVMSMPFLEQLLCPPFDAIR
jgi:hypothetical protein